MDLRDGAIASWTTNIAALSNAISAGICQKISSNLVDVMYHE